MTNSDPTPATPDAPTTIDRAFLKKLRIMGFIEGISTLFLFFVAMPLKYIGEMPMAVTIAGSIHGIFFMGLLYMFVTGMNRIPLSPELTAAGLGGAVFPFGPFVVDRWLVKLDKSVAKRDQQ